MKKRKLQAIVCGLLAAACVAAACLFAYPALNAQTQPDPARQAGILRLWHIDGFEGGKGSRASFLSRAADVFEKESGMIVLVTVHTAESARSALQAGDAPDLLSFGGDAAYIADFALPLRGLHFAAAETGGETVAYPWCRGAYFLFSADGDFSGIDAENTLLSAGRGSCIQAAAWSAGLRGAFTAETPAQAYVHWLGGKYRYLLGTQRDVQRLLTRGAQFEALPVGGYNDLLQYICICSGGQYAASLAFIEYLLSDKVQGELSQIGMLSVSCLVYTSGPLASAQPFAAKSPHAFLSADGRRQFGLVAEAALQGDENGAKNLQNFLI